jgi:hypothetical protein
MPIVSERRRDLLLVAVLLALSGCVRSCSCEGENAASSGASVEKPVTQPSPSAETSLSAEELDAAKQLSAAVSARAKEEPPPPPADVSAVFPDAASDRKERIDEQARLSALQQRLAAKTIGKADELSTREALLPLLADSAHGFKAEAAALDGMSEAGDSPVRVVSRMYKKGDAKLYVKVTDTYKAAFMRDPVLARLTQQNPAADGYLHGRVVAGYPAVAQYYPKTQSSQLMALVGGRYVVEIRMAPVANAYEAQEVFASLPVKKLAPPEEAPRKSSKRCAS